MHSGIAVIGGQGYLGSAVAQAGRPYGPVSRLVRRPRASDDVSYDFWHDDIRPRLSDATGAIVFAARVHPIADAGDPVRMRAFAARIRALAKGTTGRLLVLVSTDAVFRGDRGDYREDESPDPVTAYGRCARLLEEEVMATAERWCIVRPSYIFGFSPTGLDKRLAAARRAALEGERFDVHPDMIRSPIAVGDLARAIAEIAAFDVDGIVHAGGPTVDVATFFETALNALGHPTAALRRTAAPAGTQHDTSLRVERLAQETSVVPDDVPTALAVHRQAAIGARR